MGPASAFGSTPVGSGNLGSSGSLNLICDAPPCVLVQDTIDGAFVAVPQGVITSWSVRNATGPIALRVLRQQSGVTYVPDEFHATNISESIDETGAGNDSVQKFDTRQPVQADDYIGIALQSGSPSGSAVGGLAGDADDDLFEVPGALDPADLDVDDNTPDQYEQLLQVEVEPDADGDEYGDETQDACPTDGSTAGACPVVVQNQDPPFDPFAEVRQVGPKTTLSPRSATAAKDGSVKVTVTNGSGVEIKGSVTLSSTAAQLAARRVGVGSKRYSVPPGDSTTVKIKLSRKARRALKRRKRLALIATTTAKAAQGKSSKRTAKLTVRQPKKAAKKKPRRQGGGGVRWKARNLDRSESFGAFTFSLRNGAITLDKITTVMVSCFELGGSYRSAFSFEVFLAKGPYTLGQETQIEQEGIGVNTLVSSGKRQIRYRIKSRRSGNKITGELSIRYSGFHFGFYSGDNYVITCAGTDKFEAVPAS